MSSPSKSELSTVANEVITAATAAVDTEPNHEAPHTPVKPSNVDEEMKEQPAPVLSAPPASIHSPVAPPAHINPKPSVHLLDELQQACIEDFQRALKAHLDALLSGEQSVDGFLKWNPSSVAVISELTSTAAALHKCQLAMRIYMHHAVRSPAASASSSASSTSALYQNGWHAIVSNFADSRKRDAAMYGHKESSSYANARDVIHLTSLLDLIQYGKEHLSAQYAWQLKPALVYYFQQVSLHFLLHPSKKVKNAYDHAHSKLRKILGGSKDKASQNPEHQDETIDALLSEKWAKFLHFILFSDANLSTYVNTSQSQELQCVQFLKMLLPQIMPIKDVVDTLINTEQKLVNAAPHIGNLPNKEAMLVAQPKLPLHPSPIHSSLIIIRLMRFLSSFRLRIDTNVGVTQSYTVVFTLISLFRCDKMSGDNEMKRWICLIMHHMLHSMASSATFNQPIQKQNNNKKKRSQEKVNYKSWFSLTATTFSSVQLWLQSPVAAKKAKNWLVGVPALVDLLNLGGSELLQREMSNMLENILFKVYNCIETTEPEQGSSNEKGLLAAEVHRDDSTASQAVQCPGFAAPTSANLHTIVLHSLSRFLSMYLREVGPTARAESVVANLEKVAELYVMKNKELLLARLGGVELETWMSMQGTSSNATSINVSQASASSGSGSTPSPANANYTGFVDQQLLTELSQSSSSLLTNGMPFTKPRSSIFTQQTQDTLRVLLLTMALSTHTPLDSHSKTNSEADHEDEDEKAYVEDAENAPEEPVLNRTQKRLSMAPRCNFASPTPSVLTGPAVPPQSVNSGVFFVLQQVLMPLLQKQQRSWLTQNQRVAASTPVSTIAGSTQHEKKPSLDRNSSLESKSEKQSPIDSMTKFGTEKRGLAVPVLVALQTLCNLFGISITESVTSGCDPSMPVVMKQLLAQFPSLSPPALLRAHPSLLQTFFVPFSSMLASMLVECDRWVGQELLGRANVDFVDVEEQRRLQNSRNGLFSCLKMMPCVWPMYSTVARSAGGAWVSYELDESILLQMLIRYTVHQDERIRGEASALLRNCMMQTAETGTKATAASSFQPFVVSNQTGMPTPFKPIARASILNSLTAFLRDGFPRWFSITAAVATGASMQSEEELFLQPSEKSRVQEGCQKGLESTLELCIEFMGIWCRDMANARVEAAAEFDARELEATLISWLAADQNSVRWNALRSLSLLRTLEGRFPQPPQSLQPVEKFEVDAPEEEESKASGHEEEKAGNAIQPQAADCFISMMERCRCASNASTVAEWNGELIVSNANCIGCQLPVENAEESKQHDLEPPYHLVHVCKLAQDQWSVYYSHLLRNIKSVPLLSRLTQHSGKVLIELTDKISSVRIVQSYWKRKNAWSLTAALANRKKETLTAEAMLTAEEMQLWRNMLILNIISFAHSSLSSNPSASAEVQDLLSKRFMSLLGSNHPAIRRSACISLGCLNVSEWIGASVLAILAQVQAQMNEGEVTLHGFQHSSYTALQGASAGESPAELLVLNVSQVDSLRINLSHLFKLLAAHLEAEDLTPPPSKGGISVSCARLRSAFISYLLSSHNFLIRGHAHNEFRWDFIEWRANLARIVTRLSLLTSTEAAEDTGANSAITRTPLMADTQKRTIFEMFLSWCGYGHSSAVYTEKLKLHSAELLSKVREKRNSDLSVESISVEEKLLQQQLNASVESLQQLSLQAMATLLRGKCFDPHLQSQLLSTVSGGLDQWGHSPQSSLDNTAALASAGSQASGGAHSQDSNSNKGFVFPWLNALLVSTNPSDRDIAYEALESFILHNEHLLPSFVAHCYLVQAGSSVISKRYFLVIGNILWKQAEKQRTASSAESPKMRMLKLPLSVLLHLIIFKLGDLSFSVRSMALRLIPIVEHFYAPNSKVAPNSARSPKKNFASSTEESHSVAPMQIIIGSHLPDTYLSLQQQLSRHFSEMFSAESNDFFNECGRRIMFLHRLRMNGSNSISGAGSANTVHINNLIEENISNMIAYLAPWLSNIHLQPQSLLAGGALAANMQSPSMASPRSARSLRTFSVLTAKKGPTEIMQQLLDFTFLFSSSSNPTVGGTGNTISSAPYSIASQRIQDLYTHLIQGRSRASGHGEDEDDEDRPNPNLEILITFLFDSLSTSQRTNKLTSEWLVCYQRIALYLSRIESDQTLKLLIGHILHSATNSLGSFVSPHDSKPAATAPNSKAMLTKSNFALMLLVEVAYELDLSGEESMHTSQTKKTASKQPSAHGKSTHGNFLSPASAHQDKRVSASPSSRRASGRVSGGIRVKQPLETVALLLHIGLLGLHYPMPRTLSTPAEMQQSQVSTFIRRHATSLLINLIQATVFQTSEQLHSHHDRHSHVPRRSDVFRSPNGQGDDEQEKENKEQENEDLLELTRVPRFGNSNSRHTMNLALAPLQLATPADSPMRSADDAQEHHKLNSRYAKALQLINSMNQYLGWILAHGSAGQRQTSASCIDAEDQDELHTDAQCPVSGLNLGSLVSTLCTIIPAAMNSQAFVQAWFVLCAEWSTTGESESHFKATSLRLMEIMASHSQQENIVKKSAKQTFNSVPIEPNVSRDDLFSIVRRFETDLQPWIGEDDLSRANSTPQVLAQELRSIQAVLLVVLQKQQRARALNQAKSSSRRSGGVSLSDDERETYEEVLPRLFWLCVHIVSSFVFASSPAAQQRRSAHAILKPRIDGLVVRTALDFLIRVLSMIHGLDQSHAGGVVECIWRFKPHHDSPFSTPAAPVSSPSKAAHHRRSSSFSNFHTLKGSFQGIQNLCLQLLQNNRPELVWTPMFQENGDERRSQQMVWSKDVSATASARNGELMTHVWKILSQLSSFTAVNDLEGNVVASLIDAPFVAQLQHNTVDHSSQLHPFLLNLMLQLPAWCMTLQSAPKFTSHWSQIVSVPSKVPSSPIDIKNQAHFRENAGKLAQVAAYFHLSQLQVALCKFQQGEYHEQTSAHQQHHMPFLNEIVPLINEALIVRAAPALMMTLFELLNSAGLWLQSEKPSSSNSPKQNASIASPRQRAGTTLESKSVKSPLKKSRTFSLFSPAKKEQLNQSSATAPEAEVPVSIFHSRLQSITYDLICAFMMHIRWSMVSESHMNGVDEGMKRVFNRLRDSFATAAFEERGINLMKRIISDWNDFSHHKSAHSLSNNLCVVNSVFVRSAAPSANASAVNSPAKPLRSSMRPSTSLLHGQRDSPMIVRKSVGFNTETKKDSMIGKSTSPSLHSVLLFSPLTIPAASLEPISNMENEEEKELVATSPLKKSSVNKDEVHKIESSNKPHSFLYTITGAEDVGLPANQPSLILDNAPISPITKAQNESAYQQTPSKTYIATSSNAFMVSPVASHRSPLPQNSVLNYLQEQDEELREHSSRRSNSQDSASIVYNLATTSSPPIDQSPDDFDDSIVIRPHSNSDSDKHGSSSGTSSHQDPYDNDPEDYEQDMSVIDNPDLEDNEEAREALDRSIEMFDEEQEQMQAMSEQKEQERESDDEDQNDEEVEEEDEEEEVAIQSQAPPNLAPLSAAPSMGIFAQLQMPSSSFQKQQSDRTSQLLYEDDEEADDGNDSENYDESEVDEDSVDRDFSVPDQRNQLILRIDDDDDDDEQIMPTAVSAPARPPAVKVSTMPPTLELTPLSPAAMQLPSTATHATLPLPTHGNNMPDLSLTRGNGGSSTASPAKKSTKADPYATLSLFYQQKGGNMDSAKKTAGSSAIPRTGGGMFQDTSAASSLRSTMEEPLNVAGGSFGSALKQKPSALPAFSLNLAASSPSSTQQVDVHAVRSLFRGGNSSNSSTSSSGASSGSSTGSSLASSMSNTASKDLAEQLVQERAERQRSLDAHSAVRAERMARLAKCAQQLAGKDSHSSTSAQSGGLTGLSLLGNSARSNHSTASNASTTLKSNHSGIPQLFCPSLTFKNSPANTLQGGLHTTTAPLSPNSRVQNASINKSATGGGAGSILQGMKSFSFAQNMQFK